jgi:hypothetical protein
MANTDARIMDMIRGPQAASEAPPADMDAGAPMAAPMATPEPKMGSKEAALVNLAMALDLVEQSLPAIGSESAEGKMAIAALRSLSGILGAKKAATNELQQAEIMQLLGSLPQAGGASPEAKAMGAAPPFPTSPSPESMPPAAPGAPAP